MTDLIPVLLCLIHQCIFWLGFSIVPYAVFLPEAGSLQANLILILPIVVTGIAMRRFDAIWAIILVHLPFIAAPFLYAKASSVLFFHLFWNVMILASHIFDSAHAMRNTMVYRPRIAPLGIYIALYFIGWKLKYPILCTYIMYTFPVEVLVYFLFVFLVNREQFFERNRETADMPGGQIMRVTQIISVILMGLMSVFMLFFGGSGIGKLLWDFLVYLGELTLMFLRKMLAGIDLSQGAAEHETPGMFHPEDMPEIPDPPAWLQLLVQILEYVLFTAILLLILYAIIRFLYVLLFKTRNEIAADEDKIEYIGTIRTEAVRPDFRSIVRSVNPFVLTPTMQVRRIYHRTIKRQTPKGTILEKSYTPEELERTAGVDNKKLHQIYEKARYGKDGASAEDLAELK